MCLNFSESDTCVILEEMIFLFSPPKESRKTSLARSPDDMTHTLIPFFSLRSELRVTRNEREREREITSILVGLGDGV